MTDVLRFFGEALRSRSRRALLLAVALCAVLGATAPSEAGLVIIGDPVSGDGGIPPAGVTGGGDLVTIFNQAAHYWEQAFPDPDQDWTLIIHYAWAPIITPDGGNAIAKFYLGSVGGDPSRIAEGTIAFNNGGTTPWFADANPASNSAYADVHVAGGDYSVPAAPGGVAWVNNGITFENPTRDDAKGHYDLLTIAMHEIGHGLGLLNDPPGWAPPGQSFPVTDEVCPQYAGLEIFLDSKLEHLDGTSVIPFFPGTDTRVLPSAYDILVMAQLSTYNHPVLDAYFDVIVEGLHLPAGNQNSLLAKLRNSRARVKAGNPKAARNMLEAFIREIRANPGGRLPEDQLDALIHLAQASIAGI